jgi:Rod binding domain-containing protein
MNNINFEKDRVDSVTQIDSTKTLSDEVIKLRNLEDQVKASEEHTKALKEKARELSQVVIPQMMKEMNITKLKLKDGASIEVSNFYSAKIILEKQEAAFNWLRSNGLGDIIKNDVTVTFGRGEDNKAMAYATLAKGQGYEPVQKIGVHPQTLKAVVRERTESGQDLPADLFNTFVGNQTKITKR